MVNRPMVPGDNGRHDDDVPPSMAAVDWLVDEPEAAKPRRCAPPSRLGGYIERARAWNRGQVGWALDDCLASFIARRAAAYGADPMTSGT